MCRMWSRIQQGVRWRRGEQRAFAVRRLNLAPVKSFDIHFDPFVSDANESIRCAWFDMSKRFVRETNPRCKFNVNVRNDRCEPMLSAHLNNGHRLDFKTANMDVVQVLTYLTQYADMPEPENMKRPRADKISATATAAAIAREKNKKK